MRSSTSATACARPLSPGRPAGTPQGRHPPAASSRLQAYRPALLLLLLLQLLLSNSQLLCHKRSGQLRAVVRVRQLCSCKRGWMVGRQRLMASMGRMLLNMLGSWRELTSMMRTQKQR